MATGISLTTVYFITIIVFIFLRYLWKCYGARDVMVTVVGNGHGDLGSNPCLFHCTNTLAKSLNPIILAGFGVSELLKRG